MKVYLQQVFVNVQWNFIFSGHHVQQVLKNYLQPKYKGDTFLLVRHGDEIFPLNVG